MPLEVADYIDQLDESNPVGNIDFLDEADNHLRVIKNAVKGSFPNLGLQAVTLTAAEINQLAVDIASAIISIGDNTTDIATNAGAIVTNSDNIDINTANILLNTNNKKNKADFLRTGDRLDINNVPT